MIYIKRAAETERAGIQYAVIFHLTKPLACCRPSTIQIATLNQDVYLQTVHRGQHPVGTSRTCVTLLTMLAEQFSDAGLKVVLHIHADTRADWDFWLGTLRDHPKIGHIVREFQTGAARQEVGLASIRGLAELQSRLGRKIHLFAIGGSQFVAELHQRFSDRFTVIDSTPFVKTIKRQRLTPRVNTRPKWETCRTPVGEPLDTLLAHNIGTYRDWQKRRSREPKCNHTSAAPTPAIVTTALDTSPKQEVFNFFTDRIAA